MQCSFFLYAPRPMTVANRPSFHVNRHCLPAVAAALTLAGALPGCTSTRHTEPPRTATEQFLMSYAAMQAIKAIDAAPLEGRITFLEERYFESFDQRFMLGEIRAKLMTSGVILVDDPNEADVIIEARSAGVGVNRHVTLLGIPAFPIPVPGVGVFETPELAIYKNSRERGQASFALLAYERESREFLHATGPAVGSTLAQDMAVIGVTIVRRRDNMPQYRE